MEYTLTVITYGKHYKLFKFNSITEAYNYYLKHYSTISDWLYYFHNSGLLLSSIKDEDIMECLFIHCFTKCCIMQDRK